MSIGIKYEATQDRNTWHKRSLRKLILTFRKENSVFFSGTTIKTRNTYVHTSISIRFNSSPKDQIQREEREEKVNVLKEALTQRVWRTPHAHARTAGISSSHQRGPFRVGDATAEGRCFPTTNYASVRRFRRVCVLPWLLTHTGTRTHHTRRPTPLRIVFQYRNRKPYHYVEAPFRSTRESRPREC